MPFATVLLPQEYPARHHTKKESLANCGAFLFSLFIVLTHDTTLAALQKVDDILDLRAIGHLILNLIDYIEHTRLSVEEQTVGIGDMLLHLLVDCR